MHCFEVWAPLPKKVAVSVNGTVPPMQGPPMQGRPMRGPDEQGWWRLEVDEAGAGSDYGYLIDDDERLYPDPRSEWQPDGVHGLSRLYDQNSFAWNDAGFQSPPLASGVIYELHIGTFTPEGTLDAAIARLDVSIPKETHDGSKSIFEEHRGGGRCVGGVAADRCQNCEGCRADGCFGGFRFPERWLPSS